MIDQASFPAHPRSRAWAEYAIVFMATLLVFWGYSHFTSVPLIHGDESGYLLNAAALAGFKTDAYSSYYPGYSLFISIAYLGGASPDATYDRIQLINAVLWGISAVMLYRLVNSLQPQAPRQQRLLVLATALLYPAFLVFGSLALSENLFVPCALLLALLVFGQARDLSWGYTLGIAVAAAMLTLSHPKGALLVVAAAMAMLVNFRSRPAATLLRIVAMLVVAAVLYKLSRHYLDAHLRLMLNAEDLKAYDHYPGLKEILEDAAKIFTWTGFLRFVGVVSGQALYLVAGSLGLVALGMVWCARNLLSREAPADIKALSAYSLLSLLAVYAFSVFFMKEGVRADHIMYGRYSESVILPLLLFGALSLPAARELKWIAISMAVLAALVLVSQGNPINGSIVVMNVTTVEGIRKLLPGVLNVSGIALICAAIVMLLSRLPRAGALRLVLALFALNACYFGATFLREGSGYREKQHSLVDRVKGGFPGVRCVNYDMTSMSEWERNNYQFYLLPLRLDSVDRKDLFECGDFLITNSTDIAGTVPDAYLVAEEFDSGQKLWVRSGAFQKSASPRSSLEISAGGVVVSTLPPGNTPGLLAGWYAIEPWGSWSKPKALLSIRKPAVPASFLRLEYNTITSPDTPRTLRVACGGTLIASREIRQSRGDSLDVPYAPMAGCASSAGLLLEITVDPPASPQSLGLSKDPREMGIGLKRMEWIAD